MSKPLSLEIHLPGSDPVVHSLGFGVYPVGAEAENKIVITDEKVAGRHAILILRANGCWVEDLNSPGGTFIEGRPVSGRASFTPGQAISIGSCRLVVRLEAAPAPGGPVAPIPLRPRSPAPAPAAEEGPLTPEIIRAKKSAIKKLIHTDLLVRLDIKRLTASQIKEEELHSRALSAIDQIIGELQAELPSWLDAAVLSKEIYDEAVGLGPLEDLLSDPAVSEIMVNQYDQVYVEREGKLTITDKTFMDNASVLAAIERIVAPIGRRIDESQPYVDARLKDGSRVNAIIPPLSLKGPTLTIRKFSRDLLGVDDLVRFGTLDRRMSDFLRICVKLRKSIIVSGGTGSGKTTFLNVMSSFLPENERIITIEDAAELRLSQSHLVKLEARPPNIEGRGEVAIRDLLRNALRMRPDRIVVGECRGGEALDMLQAMNTGHDGSLTTVHANSPRDVVSRLETMTLMSGMELPSRAIREQIASAINLIVHTARLGDGSRKVTHITEVTGLEGDRLTMQDIFLFVQTGVSETGGVRGHFCATGAIPTFLETLKSRGLQVDLAMFDPRNWKPGS